MILVIVVFLICATAIYVFERSHKMSLEARKHQDASKLSISLEAKLKTMDELKAKMESLLIKNGLGR